MTKLMLVCGLLLVGCATTTAYPNSVEADERMVEKSDCEFLKSFSAYGYPMGDYNHGRRKALVKIGHEADRIGGTHFVVDSSEHSGAVHVSARIYRCPPDEVAEI